jgi:hypothetical protein
MNNYIYTLPDDILNIICEYSHELGTMLYIDKSLETINKQTNYIKWLILGDTIDSDYNENIDYTITLDNQDYDLLYYTQPLFRYLYSKTDHIKKMIHCEEKHTLENLFHSHGTCSYARGYSYHIKFANSNYQYFPREIVNCLFFINGFEYTIADVSNYNFILKETQQRKRLVYKAKRNYIAKKYIQQINQNILEKIVIIKDSL